MLRRALVIGINRYPYLEDSKSKPQHLTYPAGDAEEIGRVLSKYGHFEVTRLPETFTGEAMQVDNMGLVDQDTLEREISQLFNPTDGNIPGTALLFFAGHGLQGTLPPNEEVKGYLATSETDNECEYAISFDWLFQQLIASSVRNQIVWLDCCHSGEFTNLFAQADAKNEGQKNVNRLFIAACRDSEIAYSGIKGHGLLTSLLLKGLDPAQNIKGEWITSKSLDAFIHAELRNGSLSTFQQRVRSNSYGEQIDFWQTIISPANNPSLFPDSLRNSSQFLSNSDLSWFCSLVKDQNLDETIKKAYQDSLPPALKSDLKLWRLENNNIKQILQILERFKRLPQFLNHLIQDESLPEEIRSKLSDLKIEKMLLVSSDQLLESYLIVTVKPAEDNSKEFLLNAWLIMDDSVTLDNNPYRFLPLIDDQNQTEPEIKCKFDQIPEHLDTFIKKSEEYLEGKKYNLTLEFFLPIDLMCKEVDRWKITDPLVKEIPLGFRYPIRLRSLERQECRYLKTYESNWLKNWDKVRSALDKKPTSELFEHLQEMETFNNWKSLSSSLYEKIGIKLTCAPSQAKRKDLFIAILQATTPIAIWTRCNLKNPNLAAEIDRILTSNNLSRLCESVQKVRVEANAEENDQHLGFHLALLWENPYRLLPNIYEAKSPGE